MKERSNMKRNNLIIAGALAALLAGPQTSAFAAPNQVHSLVAQQAAAPAALAAVWAGSWHFQKVPDPAKQTLPGLTSDYNKAKEIRDAVDELDNRISELTIKLQAQWDWGCHCEYQLAYWERVGGRNCQAYKNWLKTKALAWKNYKLTENAQKTLIEKRKQKTANGTIDWQMRTAEAKFRMDNKLLPPQPINPIVIPPPVPTLNPPFDLTPPFEPPTSIG
jgi:hypothetical protein